MDFNFTSRSDNKTWTDDDYLFADHDVLMNSLTPSLIYMVILFVFGIPGNVSVLYIYYFKSRESTTRVFILALALLDTIHCTFIMPIEIALLVNFDNFDLPVICKISRFVSSFINNASAFILIAIAIDRFKRICRPHGSMIDQFMARKLVICAWIFAVVTSWQMCMLYGTRTLKRGKTCLISDHMHHTIFPTIYVYVLVVGQCITDILLVFFYSLVGQEVCQRKAKRRNRRSQCLTVDFSNFRGSLDFSDEATPSPTSGITDRFSFIFKRETSNDSSRNNNSSHTFSRESRGSSIRRNIMSKTTIMMFLVTITFILSFVPHTLAVIFRYQATSYIQSLTTSGMSMYQICLRSYFLNSVLNPFIYCFVSKQFRTQFKDSLSCSKSDELTKDVSYRRK